MTYSRGTRAGLQLELRVILAPLAAFISSFNWIGKVNHNGSWKQTIPKYWRYSILTHYAWWQKKA